MSQVIIYCKDDGVVAIICPAEEALNLYGIHLIAKKDVPTGNPYKVIDVTDLPNDRTFREAWAVDESFLTDGFGADYGVGSAFDLVGYKDSEVVIVRNKETGDVFEKPID